MGKNNIPVYGGSPQQQARIQAFLRTVNVKKLPSAVVIVPNSNFKNVAKQMAGNDTDWGFTLDGANRIYINDASFAQKHPNQHYDGPDFPEFILSHELSHMNTNTPRATQEANEVSDIEHNRPNRFDVLGDRLLNKWQKSGGDSYSSQMQRIASGQGRIQPVGAPVQTELTPPAETPQLDRTSQLMKLQSENRVSNILASKPQQTYAQKIMAQKPQ